MPTSIRKGADSVSETMPIARSPIPPVPLVTVEHGWEISARRSDAELRIMDCAPLAKVLVRASKNGETARAIAVPFGRAARDEHGALVIGSAPGEWLLLSAPGTAAGVAERVGRIPDKGLVSVLDGLYGRALVRIHGAAAA